jgi:predicted HAD superfamily Cof-like phosphohydrolase
MFDPCKDIAEFHEKFQLGYSGPPRALPDDLGLFRLGFKREELEEYSASRRELSDELTAAAEHRDHAKITSLLEDQLDALVDLVYVALGTAYLHGFDFTAAWERVHRANMAKVRATHASQSKRGSTHDVVKPAGWVAPSHTDLVNDHEHCALDTVAAE